MREFSKNAMVAGLGLCLVAISLVAVAVLARTIYCWRSKTCAAAGSNAAQSVPADYFDDTAPSVNEEVKALGSWEKHPIIIDMVPRLKDVFERQPIAVSYIQYRGYFFFEWRDVMTGDFWIWVYRWNGTAWVFVEQICETCEPPQ